MPRERPLAERVAMVKMYNQLGSARAVVTAWADAFPTAPPDHKTVLRNVEKFEATGSVKMQHKQHHRRVRTPETLQAVADLVATTEGPLSVWCGAAQVGMHKSVYHRALKDVGLKSYRPQLVVELSDDDFNLRVEHCNLWIQKWAEEHELIDRILWSDEAQFSFIRSILLYARSFKKVLV